MKWLYRSACRTLQRRISSWNQIFSTILEGEGFLSILMYLADCTTWSHGTKSAMLGGDAMEHEKKMIIIKINS